MFITASKQSRATIGPPAKRQWNLTYRSKCAWMGENQSSRYANSKGKDQPAHPCKPISAFVNRFSESVIS